VKPDDEAFFGLSGTEIQLVLSWPFAEFFRLNRHSHREGRQQHFWLVLIDGVFVQVQLSTEKRFKNPVCLECVTCDTHM